MVTGDLFPLIVTEFCDLLAIPLTKIFNLVLHSNDWPAQGKVEAVTTIPKKSNASTPGECRNISCTPLFSKVLESFMMDRINEEVKIDLKQYGGVKKCGVEQLLIQAWDNILRGLENNRGSVNLISINFAKAFNRMSHQACLKSFKKKGASQGTINLIASFLTSRQMSIKVGQSWSSKRPIRGGSPQGCVSANALFCATVEYL